MGTREPNAELSARELCGLVNELSRRIQDHVHDCAASLGLTAPQAMALHELRAPLTMRQLAERMSCEPSNITFVIDKMEKLDLVRRLPHPHDRRAKQLVLTDHGQAQRARLQEEMSLESPLGELTAADQEHLRELLLRAVGRGAPQPV
ncbi:MarR family winged helix-turn-helix transcriptional regulator [Amycolatopsis orientalis]|uniref:MarR family winged helix-turn-helix transcriptional regulator n=1 Tax=Amycolatopsis orientalis TaxID=31958 RepID=UPI0003AAAB2D|nr:MarR family transcriptional regulator [Amycolatopsis orientalis]